MNRRKFLQKLGVGAVGIAIAPFIISDIKKEQPNYILGCDTAYGDSHHIVVAKRYETVTVYIDGKKQDEKTFLINETAVWNRRLTDEEIKALYDNTVSLKNNQNVSLWI